MCVAILKPLGMRLPSQDVLHDCWIANSDGAGIAISHADSKRVDIEKGFMVWGDCKDYLKTLRDIENCAIALHFRIGTHGGISAANCHPFPLVADRTALQSLRIIYHTAVIHNGVFRLPADRMPHADMSDTAHAVAEMAKTSPERWWQGNQAVVAGNKLCVLRPHGRYSLLGEWKASKGCFFSNLNHEFTFLNYDNWKGGKWTPNTQPAHMGGSSATVPPVRIVGDTAIGTVDDIDGEIAERMAMQAEQEAEQEAEAYGNGSAYPKIHDATPHWWQTHNVARGGYVR